MLLSILPAAPTCFALISPSFSFLCAAPPPRLSCLPLISGSKQLDYDVSLSCFPEGLFHCGLSFLDEQGWNFHQIWKNVSWYFFKDFFLHTHPALLFLQPPGSRSIRLLEAVPRFTVALLVSVFIVQGCSQLLRKSWIIQDLL